MKSPSSTAPIGWRGRFLLSAIGILVSLLMVEGLLRLAGVHAWVESASPGGVWEFSRELHHRLVPDGWMQHHSLEYNYRWANNHLGMRDRERTREKPPGTFRILILGDSFVQGHSVPLEASMTADMEATLNQNPAGPRVEVLNAGVFGYSPFLEALALPALADSLSPDAVVLGFFSGNDVGEDLYYAQRAMPDSAAGRVVFEDQEWPWSRIVAALDEASPKTSSGPAQGQAGSPRRRDSNVLGQVLERSRTYRLLRDRLRTRRENAAYRDRRNREFALVRQHRGDPTLDLGFVNYPPSETAEPLWDGTLKALQTLRETCRARGIPFFLFLIPPIERLDGTTRVDEPRRILTAWGESTGVAVIDLLSAFEQGGGAALYFPYDRHWTPEGHRVAGAALVDTLRALGVPPREHAR